MKPLFSPNTVVTKESENKSDFESLLDKPIKSVPDIPQNPSLSESVQKLVRDNALTLQTESEKAITFALDVEKKLADSLNSLLEVITKGQSPVVFEMFNRLSKGVKDVNIGELKETIEASQKQSGWKKLFGQSIGKHLEEAHKKISDLLTSKSKSLLDLVKSMEIDAAKSAETVRSSVNTIKQLGENYRKLSQELYDYDLAAQEILKNGRVYLASLPESNPIELQTKKSFEQLLDLFENRSIMIKQSLAEVPVQLDFVRASEGSGLVTLSESISGSVFEFNQIKTALIKISVSYNIGSLQTLSDERRKLRENLSKHGDDQLEKVAIKAAQMSSTNRLEDANLLLESAQRLSSLADKVKAEKEAASLRNKEALEKLEQAKKIINKK